MNFIQLTMSKPEKYDTRTLPIRYIVIHDTEGTNSKDWLSKRDPVQPNNPKLAQNICSIHYLVQRDGKIYSIVPEDKRAWHVGESKMPGGETDGNSCSVGIEIENTGLLRPQEYTDAQLASVAELTAYLMTKYGIDKQRVVSHASVARPLGRKKDPVKFDWNGFWSRVDSFLTPKSETYSAQSPLLHTPNIDPEIVLRKLVTHANAEYSEYDLRLITSYYIKYGQQTGIDWVLALSQSIHETGWFSSWWSARPRRNPAGIGVTGQRRSDNPYDDKNWVQSGSIWLKGQSFPTWDDSAQHHISRLLCYALKDEEMNATQLQFSNICGAKARLASYRGAAKQLQGLNGRWAVPGTTYAQSIAKIANQLVAP